MKKPLISILVASALLAGGCAPTIGNKADVSTVTFGLVKTTKDTVAGTLGLPEDITRSAACDASTGPVATSRR